MKLEYCNSFVNYKRFNTQSVRIGNVDFGGSSPIRIQSMTNTITDEVNKTSLQCKNIFDKGADLVRITIPSLKDIANLKLIKSQLEEANYHKPISADIHFSADIAMKAAEVVEKVRINPGNFALLSNDESISDVVAIEKIKEKLIPFVKVCQQNGTAIRIGTNHGSLSNRILQKYGDTPAGMVESIMEYLRIIVSCSFHNIVISLKSSNVLVMVQANRLLVREMIREGINYPIHLGVTEAGEGIDGRIKSAVGIGTLLQDGIGDTIRVSLTENPEDEIPVCKTIVDYYSQISNAKPTSDIDISLLNSYSYIKQKSKKIDNIGGVNVPVVIGNISNISMALRSLELNKQFEGDLKPDYIYFGDYDKDNNLDIKTPLIIDYNKWNIEFLSADIYPLLNINEFLYSGLDLNIKKFLKLSLLDLTDDVISRIKKENNIIIIAELSTLNRVSNTRAIVFKLKNSGCNSPIIIGGHYSKNTDLSVIASCDFGPLFIDGLIDGIGISTKDDFTESINVAFGILQATRARISKPDYISCPGCGRTLFDLQKVSSDIRARTSHLKGVKIGIMGCIVNGPGEMADADFGYVGTSKGKVSLYKGNEPVKKNIPEKNAVLELIELIKEHNLWIEP